MNRKGFALIGLLAVAAILAIAVVFLGRETAPKVTPTATDRPTQTLVIPTATPDQTAGWKTFQDPFGRYSVKYPPDWFVRPAEEELPGKPSYITTFDLAPLFEGPPGQIVVPEGEFMVALEVWPDMVTETKLLEWAVEHDSGILKNLGRETLTLGNRTVVVQMFETPTELAMKSFLFATPNGVLILRGEPMESDQASLFDIVASTLETSE